MAVVETGWEGIQTAVVSNFLLEIDKVGYGLFLNFK
jgi:hypothetical protein